MHLNTHDKEDIAKNMQRINKYEWLKKFRALESLSLPSSHYQTTHKHCDNKQAYLRQDLCPAISVSHSLCTPLQSLTATQEKQTTLSYQTYNKYSPVLNITESRLLSCNGLFLIRQGEAILALPFLVMFLVLGIPLWICFQILSKAIIDNLALLHFSQRRLLWSTWFRGKKPSAALSLWPT